LRPASRNSNANGQTRPPRCHDAQKARTPLTIGFTLPATNPSDDFSGDVGIVRWVAGQMTEGARWRLERFPREETV
jgi:hypothetical protein